MTYKPSSIPSLPPTVDPALRNFLSAIKESLEVRLRQRGNALDASPTFQDLLDTGILKIKDGVTYIGGKSYTAEQLLGLVDNTLPGWVTSDTAPDVPSGLVVTAKKANVILTWNASTSDNYSYTEIWRAASNNLSLATNVGSTSGTTYVDNLPDENGVYYYWIRDVSTSYLESAFNTVSGTATSIGPSAIAVTFAFVGADVEFSWATPSSTLAVFVYRIEQLVSGLWQPLDLASGNSYRLKVDWTGTRSFRISALDINNTVGPSTTFAVTVPTQNALTVASTFEGEQVVLSWVAPTTTLPIDHYEVYDTAISSANLVAYQYSTVFRTKVTWVNKTYYIIAVDSAGNQSDVRMVNVAVQTGRVYNSTLGDNTFTATVIDNNVLLSWKSQAGSLPIDRFELRRGSVWETATIVGVKDGGFTTLFETPQTQVTYTYWIAAIDTGGNYGTPASVTATVNPPPDYLLAANVVSALGGTKSNAVADPSGALVMPVNTTETWTQHFSTRSWATPAAQVAAGYPVFIQPGATTGYYEEVYDHGATLAAMKITLTYLFATVAGNVTPTVTITAALDSNFTVNVQTFSGQQAYAVNFRYIKYRISVTATDDKGIASISNLSLKLDTKLKAQTGSVAANAADVGGTVVYLTDTKLSTGTKNFIDVDSITVTAASTTPVTVTYDFVDTLNPLSFTVYAFDLTGARVSATVSYQVRGY